MTGDFVQPGVGPVHALTVRRCPYCGTRISNVQHTCSAHSDLPRLDFMLAPFRPGRGERGGR